MRPRHHSTPELLLRHERLEYAARVVTHFAIPDQIDIEANDDSRALCHYRGARKTHDPDRVTCKRCRTEMGVVSNDATRRLDALYAQTVRISLQLGFTPPTRDEFQLQAARSADLHPGHERAIGPRAKPTRSSSAPSASS